MDDPDFSPDALIFWIAIGSAAWVLGMAVGGFL